MRRIALILLMIAGTAQADDWRALNGDEIRTALTGTTLTYPNATQSFQADGKTPYVAGRPSMGAWQVRGDQYCSVWPPSDHWACFDMFAKDNMLRFVGSRGDVTDGVITP
ncbi:MAG: hypothetical protein ACRBBO_12115 [Cognatishimia sp.]